MSKLETEIDFREDMKAQDRIRGRLVSGQRFAGKVHSIETDYFHIVELEVENNSEKLERVDLDIVKMRYDAVMYFGHK